MYTNTGDGAILFYKNRPGRDNHLNGVSAVSVVVSRYLLSPLDIRKHTLTKGKNCHTVIMTNDDKIMPSGSDIYDYNSTSVRSEKSFWRN